MRGLESSHAVHRLEWRLSPTNDRYRAGLRGLRRGPHRTRSPLCRLYGLENGGLAHVPVSEAPRRLEVSRCPFAGTNALYAYERLGGIQIAGPQLATGDIDLLYDARKSLRLVAPEAAAGGLLAELQKVDRSFTAVGNPGFRAVNRDGYLVDLIMPAGTDPIRRPPRNRIGSAADDLQAVEIEGLGWLVNSPKTAVTAIDARGYPVQMWVIDPRAFALHKAWLSTRGDRDPLKRSRDAAQADLVASLVRTRLPRLRFDDPALNALPRALRDLADTIGRPQASETTAVKRSEPDW